jgi:hypothetical protein
MKHSRSVRGALQYSAALPNLLKEKMFLSTPEDYQHISLPSL